VESLSATRPVRRIVRVAVALVVGQALLCALIGWLTLGHAKDSGPPVDAMAAPPALPSTSVPSPAVTSRYVPPPATTVPPAPPTKRKRTTDRKPEAPAATRAPTPSAHPPAPAPAVVPPLPVPTIVVTTTTPGSALVPPLPKPPETPAVVAGPVTVGDLCTPVGAYAFTADHTLVRCTRAWHHRARWKIV